MEDHRITQCLDTLQARIEAMESAVAIADSTLRKARKQQTQHSQRLADMLLHLDQLQEKVYDLLVKQEPVVHG